MIPDDDEVEENSSSIGEEEFYEMLPFRHLRPRVEEDNGDEDRDDRISWQFVVEGIF